MARPDRKIEQSRSLTFLIYGEWLVPREYLVLADVAELCRTVVVICLHLHDLVVQAVFVSLRTVRLLHELGGEFILVLHRQVNGDAARKESKNVNTISGYENRQVRYYRIMVQQNYQGQAF